MPAFGLNDEVLAQFGMDDDDVGQPAVTQKPKATELARAAAMPSQGGLGARMLTGYSTNTSAAQLRGVDTSTGADTGTSGGIEFAGNPDEQKAYLALRLKEIYKDDVPVRIGPQSKEPEFFSPKTKKWTTAKGTNVLNRAATAGAGAIDLVGGLGGAIGGLALGTAGGPAGMVGGAIAGGGLGAAAAEGAKLGIGKAIGAVDKDYPIGSDIASAGAEGAAFEVGSMATLGAAKYARYWFKGANAFGVKEAMELGAAAAKAGKIIDEIEQQSGMKFNPELGQKVAGAAMSPEGASAREKALAFGAALGKDPATGIDLRTLHRANEDALVGYFDSVTTPLARRAVDQAVQLSQEQATKGVAQGLTSGYDNLLTSVRQMAKQLPEELPASEAGKIMRTALATADKKFKQEIEDPAWSKYRDGTGYNPKTYTSDVQVPIDKGLRALMASWDARSRNAIIKAIKNDNSGLKLIGKDEDGPAWTASLKWDADGMPVLDKFEDHTSVDLATLDDTIKWLRSDARSALKNQQGVTYNERDLVSMERTLTGMRNDYLKESKPELFQLLQEAENATKIRASQFKNSAIGDLLVKDGPDSYRLSDAESVYRIINSKDDTAAKQFADLTKGYPEAKMQAQQMIYAMYRKAVIDPRTGAPSPKGHARFMRDYGQVIGNFFPGVERDTFRRLGGMGTAIAKEEADLKKILPQWRKLIGGEMESLNAPALARQVLTDGFSADKVRLAAGILRKNGQEDLIEEWKSSVMDELGKKLIKDGQINQSQLTKLINGPQADSLKALIDASPMKGGQAYINNLKTLDEALTMIRTKGNGTLEPQARGLLVRLSRVFFGPFSPEGRVVTFGASARTKAVPGEIYKALTDPRELDRLAKQTEKTMSQIRKATVAGALGPYISDSNY